MQPNVVIGKPRQPYLVTANKPLQHCHCFLQIRTMSQPGKATGSDEKPTPYGLNSTRTLSPARRASPERRSAERSSALSKTPEAHSTISPKHPALFPAAVDPPLPEEWIPPKDALTASESPTAAADPADDVSKAKKAGSKRSINVSGSKSKALSTARGLRSPKENDEIFRKVTINGPTKSFLKASHMWCLVTRTHNLEMQVLR